MTISELKEKIAEALKQQGFKENGILPGTTFSKGGKNYIALKVVGRHNGTDENITIGIVGLEIISDIISRIRFEERINIKMGDKAFNNRIARAVEKFNEI